jgi:hypothetical protein
MNAQKNMILVLSLYIILVHPTCTTLRYNLSNYVPNFHLLSLILTCNNESIPDAQLLLQMS